VAIAACSDAMKAVARRDDPRIRRAPLQILSKVFENRGVFRRDSRKVVESFLAPRRQACRGDIVAKNSSIDNLRKKGRLRDQLANEAGDILLPLRRKGFLVTCAAAKSDDDHLSLFYRDSRMG